MKHEHWRRAEEMFHAALEHSPETRQAFLDKACGGDAELRRQVGILIATDERAGSVFEKAALDVAATLDAGARLIGAQLGPYRVLSVLGAGGMGEVYRARDTKLGRDVAIKTLPSEFARDPERLARFRREAQTLASLNHPNIAAIYGLEASGEGDCLVLELAEGETLHGPLPMMEALRLASQIAEALEAAHEIGIVHRDLKPANVKVMSHGRVKVLDFGLAKAIWAPSPNQTTNEPGLSQTATETVLETLAGRVVGTPGYMSPEQSRGQDVDRRTDIWAFGCVLYELLTGRRAFRGETQIETIAAVLEREPDWQALPPKTPAKIRELLRRCLQKDANRRLPYIAEARRILEEARNGRNKLPIVTVAAAAITLSFAGVVWRFGENQSGTNRSPIITRLTTDSGLTAYPALSADGKLVAYASDRASNGNLDIWMQPIAGGPPIRLTTNESDDVEPSFSPDKSRIVFRSERNGGGVYVVPALGGVEQRVADIGRNPRFSPDGRWIAYWIGDASFYGRRRIHVIPAAGGQPREIQPGFFFASHPVWAPDSKHLLFRGARDAAAAQRGQFDWWVAPLNGGSAVETGAAKLQEAAALPAAERNPLHGGWGVNPGDWIGESIYFSAASGKAGVNASLWKVPISSRYRVDGPAQRLTSGTENVLQPSAAAKRIGFASVTENSNIWSLSADPNTGKVSGEPQRLTSGVAEDNLPAPSMDGSKMAFASNRTGNIRVWIKDLRSGVESALSSSAANDLPWLLSPDGSRLVYCIMDPNPLSSKGCFIASTSGGPGREFCRNCPSSSIQDWFDGGRKILYKRGISTDTGLILRDIESGVETSFLHHPKFSVTAARFSPDERWVSFQIVLEAATRREIFVAPVHGGAAADQAEWIPITDGSGLDRNAVWSPDGNLLYFLSERDGFRCFWAQPLDRTSKRPVRRPFPVYHFHQARRSLMPFQEVAGIGLSVTRNGLIFSLTETNGNIWLATF